MREAKNGSSAGLGLASMAAPASEDVGIEDLESAAGQDVGFELDLEAFAYTVHMRACSRGAAPHKYCASCRQQRILRTHMHAAVRQSQSQTQTCRCKHSATEARRTQHHGGCTASSQGRRHKSDGPGQKTRHCRM